MQIQYELLKTTSKRTFESYIRNSRQIKNSWKISPYTFFLSLKNNGAFSQYVLTGSLLVMLHVVFTILKEGLSGIITVSRQTA